MAVLAAAMMVAEVCGGIWFGSMAVLADGLHMASHTLAMGIAVFAYGYARRHAASPRFAFGTGKVNALGGYTGALLLGCTATWMMWEGAERMLHPGNVRYGEAIALAVAGLAINVASAWLLREDHAHSSEGAGCSHAHDHNLRAAYLHVMADAVTSVIALGALVGARAFELAWLDSFAGVAGGALVAWWSIGLLRTSSYVLLDHQGPHSLQDAIRRALKEDEPRIADLRCWAVAPGRYAVAVCLGHGITRSVVDHKRTLAKDARVVWTIIEVQR